MSSNPRHIKKKEQDSNQKIKDAILSIKFHLDKTVKLFVLRSHLHWLNGISRPDMHSFEPVAVELKSLLSNDVLFLNSVLAQMLGSAILLETAFHGEEERQGQGTSGNKVQVQPTK
jgi:3-phosphoglycerate kinase